MNLRLNKHLLFLFSFLCFYLIFHYIWLYIYRGDVFMTNMGSNAGCIIADLTASFSLWKTYKNSTEKTRRFWMFLALSCTSFLIGDGFWFYENGFFDMRDTPGSFSGLFFILFVIFYLIAFFYKITYEYDLLQKLFILCDIGTTFIAAITLEYYIIIGKILNQEAVSLFCKYVELMYPFTNILLLLICVSLYFQPLTFSSKRVLYVLISSVFFYVLADSVYSFLIYTHAKFSLDMLNPLYQISMILTAIAGVLNIRQPNLKEHTNSEKKEDEIQLSLSYLAAICLSAFTLSQKSISYHLIIGLCTAFAFVLLRQALVRAQSKKLLTKLKQFNAELGSRIEERTRDLTEQQEALLQGEQKFKSLYEFHPDPIFTIDLQGRFQQVNKAGIILLGYQASELLGQSYQSLVYEKDLKQVLAASGSVMNGRSSSFEVRAYHKNRDVYYLNVTTVPIWKKDEVHGTYMMVKDITEMKMQQQQINFLAFHDTLTGLSNRRYFADDLEKAIRKAEIVKTRLAILFIDLDRFKVINDTLGHTIGDLVLIGVAQKLKVCTPLNGRLARLGGDEFTILIENYASREEIEYHANKILEILQEPVFVEGHTLHITPSIGIAIYPEAGEDAESLLKHADMAMYNSKNNGKNSFSVYNEEMSHKIRRRLRLEKDLYQALQFNELFLLYQPQIDIKKRRVIGMEALLRWKHPQLGMISPNEFIPIAEDTNLIIPIGEWVLREACRQMQAWNMIGHDSLKVGVNLSAKQFKQDRFIGTITSILQETGLAPHFLDLELTERIAMTNEEETLEKLKKLKELGIHISIDDFGTGYSSLAYLPLYPLDTLKIAREFIHMADSSQEGKAIISAILSLAHTLNITVIAEGAETKEQISFLYKHGCYQVQGYYFSRPISSDEAIRFLETFS